MQHFLRLRRLVLAAEAVNLRGRLLLEDVLGLELGHLGVLRTLLTLAGAAALLDTPGAHGGREDLRRLGTCALLHPGRRAPRDRYDFSDRDRQWKDREDQTHVVMDAATSPELVHTAEISRCSEPRCAMRRPGTSLPVLVFCARILTDIPNK